jgi:hypothetical protein
MAPYFLMLALPGLPAAMSARFSFALWRIMFVFYWLMIGFRFRVGTDWKNYVRINESIEARSLADVLIGTEPGYAVLVWLAGHLGGGFILVNAVSALIFCWGLSAFAKRCPEPFLAIAFATPLIVIAMAMNLTRQAIAFGIIANLFATWDRRGLVTRTALVLVAASFHFSAVFILIFVALAARATPLVRYGGAIAAGLLIVLISYLAPEIMDFYNRTYISGRVQAPGANLHVAVIATLALAYLMFRRKWARVQGEELLYVYLAIAALCAVPMLYLSSVAAYRFGLYLWPMAMYVFSGMPNIIDSDEGREIYRVAGVAATVLLLFAWLTFANNSQDWLPYQNWLLQPDHVRLAG